LINQLLNKAVKKFIQEHVQDHPARLSLKYKSISETDIKLIAGQIAARQKAIKKFPLWSSNYDIIFPDSVAVEQASSQTAAEYKAGLFKGDLALDLTGGLGIDTLTLSKKFRKMIYVEADAFKAQVAKHNFSILNAENIEVVNSSAEDFLKSNSLHADLIYIDPDRRPGAGRIISLEKSLPDVVQLQDQLLSSADHVMIKTSPMLDISATIHALKNVKEVHVLSIQNECKELLFVMSSNTDETCKITAASRRHDQWQKFSAAFPPEHRASINPPQSFIYEPDAAILKAGLQDELSTKYMLNKLHPSTNLYTSDTLANAFPGRAFKLQDIVPVNKKTLKTYLPEMKANIATRNFPEHVDKLKKKLQLKDGGKHYLFACILSDLTYKILITEKA
jgi:16S rRNA G966 N2-methylase RsmD